MDGGDPLPSAWAFTWWIHGELGLISDLVFLESSSFRAHILLIFIKMQKLLSMLVVVWASSWGLVAQAAETHAFTLENGNVVEGYIADMDEETLIVRKNRGDFSERIELVYLSQETLKWIKQQPSYLAKGYDQLVDPYLELPEEEIQPPIINVRDPERPLQAVTKEDGSFAASLGSPIGLLLVLAVYFGNLYAALHIAQFMSRPVAVVCGVSAIFPVFGPILFACMPPMVEESHAASAPDVPAAPSSGGAPPPSAPSCTGCGCGCQAGTGCRSGQEGWSCRRWSRRAGFFEQRYRIYQEFFRNDFLRILSSGAISQDQGSGACLQDRQKRSGCHTHHPYFCEGSLSALSGCARGNAGIWGDHDH